MAKHGTPLDQDTAGNNEIKNTLLLLFSMVFPLVILFVFACLTILNSLTQKRTVNEHKIIQNTYYVNNVTKQMMWQHFLITYFFNFSFVFSRSELEKKTSLELYIIISSLMSPLKKMANIHIRFKWICNR